MSSSSDLPVLGAFTTESQLTDGHILTTTLATADGTKLTSALDLNSIIGNNNGAFSWGGNNFSAGAQNIQIVNGFELTGQLPDNNGNLANAVMYIGSTVGTDENGKPAIHHYAAIVDSTAHAEADTNAEADAAVHSQVVTTSSESSIQSIKTLQGDASTYYPDGNAPAAGSHFSRPPWETTSHFVLMIIECVARMILI